jgi:predicted transcriptional regulator
MDEKIWQSKLVESLWGKVSKNIVSRSLDVLSDWGMIESEYAETTKGRTARVYYINDNIQPTINDLYERLWRDFRE